jgi:hypothetical protein
MAKIVIKFKPDDTPNEPVKENLKKAGFIYSGPPRHQWELKINGVPMSAEARIER